MINKCLSYKLLIFLQQTFAFPHGPKSNLKEEVFKRGLSVLSCGEFQQVLLASPFASRLGVRVRSFLRDKLFELQNPDSSTQGFSTAVPGPAHRRSGSLLEVSVLRSQPRGPEWETWGSGLATCFNKLSRVWL